MELIFVPVITIKTIIEAHAATAHEEVMAASLWLLHVFCKIPLDERIWIDLWYIYYVIE